MISGSLGKNGWIKWNYYRTHEDPWPEVDFDVSFEPQYKSQIVEFKTAGMNVAKDIGSSYSNIYLALSGGIDSEFAAQCFLDSGVPFTPIIAEIKGSNEFDYWYACRWCKEHNIKPIVIEVSLEDIKKEAINIIKKTFTRTVGPILWNILNQHVKKLNGNLVTGAGDIEYFPDPLFYAEWMHDDKTEETYDILAENNIINQGYLFQEPEIISSMILKDAPWNFYTWTPEIVLSMIANRDPNKNTQENKITLTGCMPRPKNISLTKEFNRSNNELKNLFTLRVLLGRNENYFLGNKDNLIKLLS